MIKQPFLAIRLKLLVTVLFICPLISGCSAPDGTTDIGSDESPAWHQTASLQTKISYFGTQCEAFGFQKGTSEYSNCLKDLMTESKSAAAKKMANTGSFSDAYAKSMRSSYADQSTVCRTVGSYTYCN